MRSNDSRDAPDGNFWRVAVVEDHLMQRRATVQVLNQQSGIRVVAESRSLPELLDWLRGTGPAERPHLVVLDLIVDRGPNAEPDAVRQLVRDGIRVLVFSALSSPPLVRRVVRAGVGGVVGKHDPESDLVAAIWTVLGRSRWVTPALETVLAASASRPALSDQEERTLVLYASGHTLASVAVALGVKHETAKTYLARVKKKYTALGRRANSKSDLVRHAVADGYIEP